MRAAISYSAAFFTRQPFARWRRYLAIRSAIAGRIRARAPRRAGAVTARDLDPF